MWETISPFVGLLVGAVLRYFVPWIVEGLKRVGEREDWLAFPCLSPKYLSSVVIAVVGFVIAFLTVPGLFEAFCSWGFIPAIALSYSGQALGRDLIKGIGGVKSIVSRH